MLTKGLIFICIALLSQSIQTLSSLHAMLSPVAYGNVAVRTDLETTPRNDVLFVGDIMLGRAIERIIADNGQYYPYAAVRPFLSERALTVGNFEASVPETHVPTDDFGFAFSVRETTLAAAHHAGFDVFSLANNHAFDFGAEGYNHTRTACARHALRCIGHPHVLDTDAVQTSVINGVAVAIIALNALTDAYTHEELVALLTTVTQRTDFQIAYVHWGDEYEDTHNAAQAAFGAFLIERGVDAVIGHHPHVVQDIAMYQGKPIFYSLGNFIFDQYFSDAVQEGLAVLLTFEPTQVQFSLHPVSSIEHRGQPAHMEPDRRQAFIDDVLARSTLGSTTVSADGVFTIDYD